MHEKMSREEFWKWHRLRMRWALFLDTSEALIMFITFLWGLYLIVMADSPHPDPVSVSLLQLWPGLPLWVHGTGLLSVAAAHAYAMRYAYRGLRRRMIMAQMVWFMYDEFSLWFAHVYPPFIAICLAYVLACIVNYYSLMRPASGVQEQHVPCKPDK